MAFRLKGIIDLDNSPLKRGIRGVRRLIKPLESDFSRLGRRITTAFTAGFIAFQTQKAVRAAGEIDTLSKILGVTAERYQELDFWIKRNGNSVEDLRVSWNALSKTLDNALKGNQQSLADLQALGLTMDDIKSKSIEDLFLQIGENVRTTSRSTDELRVILLRALGESGARMLSTFKTSFQETADEARRFGQIIDNETVNTLSTLASQFVFLDKFFTTLIANHLPKVVEWTSNVVEGFREIGAWARYVARGMIATAKGIQGIFDNPLKSIKDIPGAFRDVVRNAFSLENSYASDKLIEELGAINRSHSNFMTGFKSLGSRPQPATDPISIDNPRESTVLSSSSGGESSLVRIGNFLHAQRSTLNIQKDILTQLKSIERNTRNTGSSLNAQGVPLK